MRACTEKQRNFVLAMAADPFGNPTKWAKAAGFSAASYGALRVTAHRLAHAAGVQAAVEEVARAHLNTFGPVLASLGLLRIARQRSHPKHARALEMIANRVGLHETTEHKVTVLRDDPLSKIEEIKQMAALLGVDAAKLLGLNTPKLIEGEVVDVGRADGA